MAEERPLSLQTHNINSVPPNADHSPSIQSAPAGRQSTLNSAVRRRPSLSPKTMSASHLIQDNPSQKKTRAGAQKARETSRSSNMQIPDMEITYTPTTHRISKAKKGKKVHACEFPGCNKIFTRAEHRKRHEANHNTSPAYQCQVEGCKKPFQRMDLLTRHMEKQHNMPIDSSSKSQYARSIHSASPTLGQVGIPRLGRHPPSTASSLAQSAGTMSIGSIIEHNHPLSSEYRSRAIANGLQQELSAPTPIGTAPRSLHPDMLYGLTSGDSPLYASSDSCYSPISDYLQPSQPMAPYFGHEIPRPQTVAAESNFQAMVNSPMTHSPVSVGPPTPAWGPTYDPLTLGFVNEASCAQSVRTYGPAFSVVPVADRIQQQQQQQLQYSSPQWSNANTIPQYELAVPNQQAWPWTKVSF